MRIGEDVSRTAYRQGYESLSGFQDAFRKLVGSPPSEVAAEGIVRVSRLLTPLGPMLVGGTDDAVCLLEFVDRRMIETQLKRVRQRLETALVPGSSPATTEMERQLSAYFERKLSVFTVPIQAPGTEFQMRVWDALTAIPYGTTASYGEIARRIGQPTAVRAVARANGDNRIAIVIPCHRVIGSDGSLTGYGGGLWRKKWLLELESGQTEAFDSQPGSPLLT
jgi:AraC family transcriptional regulator of adaptative response/methylated-DNA-[protein]-cysteine methyltransferase